MALFGVGVELPVAAAGFAGASQGIVRISDSMQVVSIEFVVEGVGIAGE